MNPRRHWCERIGTRFGLGICTAGLALLLLCSIPAWASERPSEDEGGIGCSIFVVQVGDSVWFGNNVDDGNPRTFYSISPARGEGEYGYITLGFNQPQGGLNEAGLAFDTNAVPSAALISHPELPRHAQGAIGIVLEILRYAATVEQALEIAESYHWGDELANQWLIADAQGDAVVISAGRDGELAFTRKKPGDGYLTSTNINRSRSPLVAACPRFRTISRMLARSVRAGSMVVQDVVDVLDAAHQEGIFLREGVLLNTVYSNVYDLNSRQIILYYWYQFDAPRTLQLDEELAKGSMRIRVRDLFPGEVVRRAAAENERLLEQAEHRRELARAWMPVVGATALLGIALLVGSVLLHDGS